MGAHKPTQDEIFEHLRRQTWQVSEFIEIYSPQWDAYGNWDLTFARRTIRKNAIASIIELDDDYYRFRKLTGNYVALEPVGSVSQVIAAGSYELFRIVLKYRHDQDTSQ